MVKIKKTSAPINIFASLLLLSIVCAMGSVYMDNQAIRIVSYVSECALIIFMFSHSSMKGLLYRNALLPFCSIILIFNYLFSQYEPHYADLLKFFGYLCCYMYGSTLAKKHDVIKIKRLLLYLLVFVPVVVVAVFDRTVEKNMFFVNSNTFVYTGLSMGLLYSLINTYKKIFLFYSWIIVLFYVLICTSLGVLFAIIIAYLILNLKKNQIPYLIIGIITLLFAVLYVDIPLFIRLRDVLNLWASISWSDWKNIQDINIYDISQSVDVKGERTDNTSSVWRMSHWIQIFIGYITSWWCIPFGTGENFARSEFGNAPHNDFLKILVEFGLIVFCGFIKLVRMAYVNLKKNVALIYFVLPMFLYHITENLIDTFPPNVILYFTLGWGVTKNNIDKNNIQVMTELKDESTIN